MSAYHWPVIGPWLQGCAVDRGIEIGEGLLRRGYSPCVIQRYAKDVARATAEAGNMAEHYEAKGMLLAAERAL